MNPTIDVNERVGVVSTYRLNSNGKASFFPLKMKYKGEEITFTKLALKHPTSKGQRMIHVFDMSDGDTDYRLEFDAERLTWMFASMIQGERRMSHGAKN